MAPHSIPLVSMLPSTLNLELSSEATFLLWCHTGRFLLEFWSRLLPGCWPFSSQAGLQAGLSIPSPWITRNALAWFGVNGEGTQWEMLKSSPASTVCSSHPLGRQWWVFQVWAVCAGDGPSKPIIQKGKFPSCSGLHGKHMRYYCIMKIV